MNKIFKVITRQGRAVVCDEATKVGGGARGVVVAVALALGASSAAWAEISETHGNWGDVDITKDENYTLSTTDNIIIGSLKGHNKGTDLEITANGNNFTIDMLQFSMSGGSSTLKMKDVGNVKINKWIPYSTDTHIYAKEGTTSTFSSTETSFWSGGSEAKVTLKGFNDVNLGNVTFNEPTHLTFTDNDNVQMNWLGGSHGSQSSIMLSESALKVTGSDKVTMGKWSLANSSSLTLDTSHTAKDFWFGNTGNKLVLGGDLTVSGTLYNHEAKNFTHKLEIDASRHNITLGTLGIGVNLAETAVTVKNAGDISMTTFNIANGSLEATGTATSSTFKAGVTNINGDATSANEIRLTNFKNVDFGTFNINASANNATSDLFTLRLDTVESAKLTFGKTLTNSQFDLLLKESNLSTNGDTKLNNLVYGGQGNSLTVNGNLSLVTLRDNLTHFENNSVNAKGPESMAIDMQGHNMSATNMYIGFNHVKSQLLVDDVAQLTTSIMSLANSAIEISGHDSNSSSLTNTTLNFYSEQNVAEQTTLHLKNFKAANLGTVTFNQKATLGLTNVAAATMTYNADSTKADQAQYVLNNSALTIKPTQSFAANAIIFQGEGKSTFSLTGSETTTTADTTTSAFNLGNVLFNQEATLALKNVGKVEQKQNSSADPYWSITGSSMTYAGGGKASQSHYVLDNSGLNVQAAASQFVAGSIHFKGKLSAFTLTGANEIFINDILTDEGSESALTIDSSHSNQTLNVFGNVNLTHLGEQVSSNLTINLLGENATFDINGEQDAVDMNQSKLTLVGTGSQKVSLNHLLMGSKGLAFSNLKEFSINRFDIDTSTNDDDASINLDRIEKASIRFVDNEEEGYKFNVKDSHATFDLTETPSAAFTFNVTSTGDLTRAAGFSTIGFKNDQWAASTVNLQKGAWLTLGSDKMHEATVDQALTAFAKEGKTFESIVSLSGQSNWLTTQKLQAKSLMMVVDGQGANKDTALLTGLTNNVTLDNVGFYFNVSNDDFEAGEVLKIADGSIWKDYNGQSVGANNIFTDWTVESADGTLNFKLAEIKSVTEVLPEVIPEKGFEEIFGKKVPGEDGKDKWEKGIGVDQFVNKETGEVGVGGALAQAILSGGLGDSDLTTEIANTFASFGVVGGAQAGANTVSSMSAQTLARHYSFATTTGINPLEVHQPGTDLWVDFTYTHDKMRDLSNGSGEYGHRTNLRGFALGLDNTIDNQLTIGGVFNYVKGRTDSNQGFVDIDNDMESFGLTAWAGFNVSDKCNLVADISYARGSNEMNSALTGIMAETFQDVYANSTTRPQDWAKDSKVDTKADMDTETFSLGVRAEHVIRTAYMDIIPHVGVRWDHIKTDSYALKVGGHDAVHTEVDNMNVFSLPIGVSVAKSKQDAKTGWNARVMADAYVMPRFGDTEATVSSRFAAYKAIDKGEMEVMSDLSYGMTLGAQLYTKKTVMGVSASMNGSNKNSSASLNANFTYRF